MARFRKLAVLLLAVALLLTGCFMPRLRSVVKDVYTQLYWGSVPSFDEIEYVRTDLDAFQQELETCMEMAQTEENVSKLMDQVYAVYELYYDFYTNYNLADIHYCIDMTDIYWGEEYDYCLESSAQIDGSMDQLLYALADSPLRQELEAEAYFGEGFFDSYEGDSIWDETFTALSEQENALISKYYDIAAQAAQVETYSEEYYTEYASALEQVFVELVAVRQQMAAYAGYDSYADYAYDTLYYRDYTPEQAAEYTEQLRLALSELYAGLDSTVWEPMYTACTETQALAYTEECAKALGGVAEDAFELMTTAELYDISYSENKYNASFETYLFSYYLPFVYVCPRGSEYDKTALIHEFGHFCSDYAAGGSYVGIDVAEVFSQGLEYLSLCYCEDTEALTRMTMALSLCTFVEQAAYASFEDQVYEMSAEALTVENVRALFQRVLEDYGMASYGYNCQDYVAVAHFFICPMYVISYVVSNDAAMQIYQAELAQTGSGVALWESELATEEAYFLAFLEEAGLESPFSGERAQQLRETFVEILG